MSTWRIGKLTIGSGGSSSDLGVSKQLKTGGAAFRYGPPPGMWTVDPNSDWSIHQWATNEAHVRGEKISTDYKPSDSDIPEEIQKHMRTLRKSKPSKGMVY